jgi:hypothetical protein
MQTLLYAATGALLPGAWLPLRYGCFTLAVAWALIEWNRRHWRRSLFKRKD